jgi:alpha-tubulin suppressor-like RCC1 family protein
VSRLHDRRRCSLAQHLKLRTDLLEPHILRSLSNVKATSIHTSCCGCHCIVLDVDGVAWLFGRNSPSALGEKGDVISENAPRKLKAKELGAPAGVKFVHAACGRNHSLLVGSNGHVWTAGVNNMGQVCTEYYACPLVFNIPIPKRIV